MNTYYCWECDQEIPPKEHYGDPETLMLRCSECREREEKAWRRTHDQ